MLSGLIRKLFISISTGILIIIFIPFISFAEDISLDEFDPGTVEVRGSFYNGWMFAIFPEIEEVSVYDTIHKNNPLIRDMLKGWKFSSGAHVGIEFIYPLVMDVNEIYELVQDDTLQNELDEAIKDALEEEVESGAEISAPDLEARFGQQGGVTKVDFLIPYRSFVVGGRWRKLFSLDINVLLTGADVLVLTDTEFGDVSFRGKPTILLDKKINIYETSLRLGSMITRNWTLDAYLTKYEVSGEMDLSAEVNAMAYFAGNTEEFNTDSHNSLSQAGSGSYGGSGYGYKIGTSYYMSRGKFCLSTFYEDAGSIDITGTGDYTIRYPEEDVDITDITATKEERDSVTGETELFFPKSGTVSLSWRTNGLNLIMGYTHYLESAKLTYAYQTKDDSSEGEEDIGLSGAVHFSFLTRYFSLKLGAAFNDRMDLPIPNLTLMAGIPVGGHWQFDSLIVATPGYFANTRVVYKF